MNIKEYQNLIIAGIAALVLVVVPVETYFLWNHPEPMKIVKVDNTCKVIKDILDKQYSHIKGLTIECEESEVGNPVHH